jgi:tetratricopeptide (TPR) repeat protein
MTAALLLLTFILTLAPDSASAQAGTIAGTIAGTEILKLTASGRHEEARMKATARLAVVKDDIDAYVALSWSLVALGRHQEAEIQAAKGYSLRKDPRLAQAQGEAAFALGKNEVALKMLEEYLATFPEGPRAGNSYYLCGELYLRFAKFNHADIALSAAVLHFPNNPQWLTRLGWAREKSRKYLQALNAYEQALALNPNLLDAQEGRKRIQDRMRG